MQVCTQHSSKDRTTATAKAAQQRLRVQAGQDVGGEATRLEEGSCEGEAERRAVLSDR